MKPCIKCGAIDRMASGRCRPCTKDYKAAYHQANKEKARVKNAAWEKANPEKVKARHAAWYLINQEKSKAYGAKWRKENPEKERNRKAKYRKENSDKMKAIRIAWRKANPDRVCATASRRRSNQLNATPIWGNEFFIDEIYDLAQRRTKATGFKWHVDHIVPLQSKFVCGLHVEHNLAVVPASYNHIKNNKYWPDMP